METELRVCEDGSHTLFSERAGECYHSTHGAYTESIHIFINLGFRAVVEGFVDKKNTVRILEVGFGTGLNALLTALEAERHHISVSYLGLEPYPIIPATLQQLNYCTLLSGNSNKLFTVMHSSEWNSSHQIHPYFNFMKRQVGFMEVDLQRDGFDLIYFDAFSPDAQPELWGADVFQKCFEVLAKDGTLVTYCAKGAVKRALKLAGFTIENLPGPPGKREITRARKLV